MRTLFSALLLAGTLLPCGARAQCCEPGGWQVRRVVQFPSPPSAEVGGYLGVKLTDIDAERAKALELNEERGVEIKMVMEGGPADKAGIRPGDVLLSYNGENLLGAEQLARLVRETPPGRHVKVQYWRDGKTQTTIVAVGAAPTISATPFLGVPEQNWQLPPMDIPSPLLVWRNSAVGIEFERVDSQLAEYFGVRGGVLVRSVQRASPAERAGIRAGDVIFSVAQQALSNERDFSSLLRQRGMAVPVSLMRDHRRVDLTITLP